MKFLQHLLLLISTTFLFNNALRATNIVFIQNNLEQAKQQASLEGKLIMVDFWANWCNPCQWMDEQTFSNSEVAAYLNDNYVSVRVDIDNLEGYNYKEEYNVRYLPTILILNERGELIKKYEESFAPSKLIQLLKLHNKGSNNKQHYEGASTNYYTPANPVAQEEVLPAPSYKPALSTDYIDNSNTLDDYTTNEELNNQNNTASNTSYSSSQNSYTAAAPTINTTSTYKPANNYTTAQTTSSGYSSIGLYQFNVQPAPSSGYSVQVGAYYDYGNVLSEVAALQGKYQDIILVHISELNGAPCYKILLGHFDAYESAGRQKAFLREKGLDCFVKELATMGRTMQ